VPARTIPLAGCQKSAFPNIFELDGSNLIVSQPLIQQAIGHRKFV
jgi:hypothetical protein